MRKIFLLSALILVGCISCKNEAIELKKQRAFILCGSEDNNWTTTSAIHCDSVQMVNLNQCIYYIDGHKFNFYSRIVKIQTTNED